MSENVKGYQMLKTTLFENNRGVALGYNPEKAPYPFATWYFTENKGGERDYFRIHECMNRPVAEQDFYKRVDNYKIVYKVQEKTEGQESGEYYRYYSTQRPVDIGTFPNTTENPVFEVANYDGDSRQYVAGGQVCAWGEVTYKKPLTEKQIDDYELLAAPDNPDIADKAHAAEKRGERKSIAAKLAEGAAQAAKDNAARPAAEKNTDKDR